MNADGSRAAPAPRNRRKLLLGFGGLAVVLLLLALSLRIVLQPELVTDLLLSRLGQALGLEITATGTAEYHLRGTPRLVVRGLSAREPGSKTPVLQAERVFVSVPWATLRSRGELLDIRRIEIDGATLDLPALQTWLDRRPPAEGRLPTLIDGLAVRESRILAAGWSVEALRLDLPRFAPEKSLSGHASGRYLDAPLSAGFDLDLAMTRPALPAGVGAAGSVVVASGDWRLPARVRASVPLDWRDGALRGDPLRLAAQARYESGDSAHDFALGLNAGTRLADGSMRFAPAFVAVRGQGAVPTFDARGQLDAGGRLLVRLDGELREWNAQWPALPPPIGQSGSPLPFALDYLGRGDMGDIATLRLRRDESRFDGRFRLPDVLDWMDNAGQGTPLPPLQGRVSTPRIEISGASLEGVDIEFDDPDVAEAIEDAPATAAEPIQ